MKPVFTATAVIMPPQQQQSAATAMLGQLAPLAALSGHDIGMKSPSDVFIGMLRSRTIADDLIAKFQAKSALSRKGSHDCSLAVELAYSDHDRAKIR